MDYIIKVNENERLVFIRGKGSWSLQSMAKFTQEYGEKISGLVTDSFGFYTQVVDTREWNMKQMEDRDNIEVLVRKFFDWWSSRGLIAAAYIVDNFRDTITSRSFLLHRDQISVLHFEDEEIAIHWAKIKIDVKWAKVKVSIRNQD